MALIPFVEWRPDMPARRALCPGYAAHTAPAGRRWVDDALASRGALAAGAERPRLPVTFAMDETARSERARVTGGSGRRFDTFARNPMDRSSGPPSTVGVTWSAGKPVLAGRFADLASRAIQGTGSHLALTARWNNLAGLRLGDGYDAVGLKNYTTFPDFGPEMIGVFRDPNQLRSRFSTLDPARRDSARPLPDRVH